MADVPAVPVVAPPPRATRREWIGLAVLALPCVLYAMDLTVLNLAVPHLARDLRPTPSQLLWIVDIYGFMVAGFLITMGTLGDRIGRRRLLLLGAGAFAVTSVVAAFAETTGQLIAARAVLGLSAACLAPSMLSLIRTMFHDAGQRTVAISIWVASFSAGGALGPLIGGLVLEHFWWGAVFLLAVPLVLPLLILGPLLLPEYRDPAPGRLDIASALLSLLAVLAIILGVKLWAEDGLGGESGWWPLAAILAGLGVALVFVRRQSRLAKPLIDLTLFRARSFSAALGIAVLGFMVAFGTFLLVAQHLQLVLGMSPLEAGLWTGPSGLGFVVGSLLAPSLVRRWSRASVMAGGFLLSALGFLLIALGGEANPPLLLVAGLTVLSLGLAQSATLTTDIVVGTVEPAQAGAAAAMSETGIELGGALGIALLGSLTTAIYLGALEPLLPAALPAAVREAALDGLGPLLVASESLPAESGAALLALGRGAFTQAFEVGAACGAVLSLASALLTLWLLRRVPAAGH